MDYNQPLTAGRFLKRYKRFFADVEVDGAVVVAHVPNTGSLKGICDEPRSCRVQRSDNPERKLKWTLEQVETATSWVGVNTHNANVIAWEAFTTKAMPHWQAYVDGAREAKVSAETRLDMKLIGPGALHFVEVKSVTMAENGVAMFPDAVTTRGQKHISELMRLIREGATAELLFVVQRTDCTEFNAAAHIDADYARLLAEAIRDGLTVKIKPAVLSDSRLILNANVDLNLCAF